MRLRISKILIALNGFILFGSSIDSIREVIQTFSEDIHHAIFIDEWLALSAIIPFGLGWLASHLMENFIKHDQSGYAKVSGLSFLACGIALLLSLLFFVRDGFFKEIGFASIYLICSGFFLRYSIFDDERYLLSEQMFSSKKSENKSCK